MKYTPAKIEARIEFLRNTIREVIKDHAVPCGCVLCENLVFEYMAKNGQYRLFKNQRKCR